MAGAWAPVNPACPGERWSLARKTMSSSSDPNRDRRLAEALRANLRRRKAQARGDEAGQTRDDTQPASE